MVDLLHRHHAGTRLLLEVAEDLGDEPVAPETDASDSGGFGEAAVARVPRAQPVGEDVELHDTQRSVARARRRNPATRVERSLAEQTAAVAITGTRTPHRARQPPRKGRERACDHR